MDFWSLASLGGAPVICVAPQSRCVPGIMSEVGIVWTRVAHGIGETVGCHDNARVMDVMGCGFISAANDGFGLETERGRIAVGIRWSRGFRSGGVEVEVSSLSTGIVRCLVLVIPWRAMSMAGSWHCDICL